MGEKYLVAQSKLVSELFPDFYMGHQKRSFHMTVTIIRRTGFIGMAAAISLKINGDKVGKVVSDHEVEIALLSNKAQLTVSQFGTRSNVLEINDGETIEISTSKSSNFVFFSMVFFPILINFIQSFQYRAITLVIYAVFALLVLFGKKWYHINKI